MLKSTETRYHAEVLDHIDCGDPGLNDYLQNTTAIAPLLSHGKAFPSYLFIYNINQEQTPTFVKKKKIQENLRATLHLQGADVVHTALHDVLAG